MEKHCEKCVKENIGCKEIQHLFRDVDKLKASKNFNTFLYIFIAVISVGFVIVSIIVWHNMLKQSISTADLKPEELKNMADLFNSQFSNLLTVLRILLNIFGVAIPILNAIYQKQTLKDERESLRREIDFSLANLDVEEKKLIESAKEEREKQIENVRSDLAKSIQNAEKHFKSTFAGFEKEYKRDSGYFFLQFALTNRGDYFVYYTYCSYAILCYSTYAETDNTFAERFYFSINEFNEDFRQRYEKNQFDSSLITKNIKFAQKNVEADSDYWQQMQKIVDMIEELDKKKAAEKKSGSVA